MAAVMTRLLAGLTWLLVCVVATVVANEDGRPSYKYGLPISVECMNRSS